MRAIEGSATHVLATVRGSERTRCSSRAMAMSSPRPASARFTDRHDLCKHVWAVVLAADAEGYLIGDAPITEDAFWSPIIWRARRPSRPARREPAPLEAWRRFLENVQARSTGDAAGTPSRDAQGEILYVIDAEAITRDPVPVVQVQWRTRKKNGEWGKPQPAPVAIADIPACPTNTIARCWRNSSAHRTVFSRATNTSRASFRLAGPLIGRVLPLIARSGRLYPPRWQRASGRSVAARLGSGETWTFQLDVELVPDGRIRVDGAFVRGDVRCRSPGAVAFSRVSDCRRWRFTRGSPRRVRLGDRAAQIGPRDDSRRGRPEVDRSVGAIERGSIAAAGTAALRSGRGDAEAANPDGALEPAAGPRDAKSWMLPEFDYAARRCRRAPRPPPTTPNGGA